MATVSELRVLESATCAYGVTIEGLPYMWVTDHPDDGLLGTGSGSWIGDYESANTAHEQLGQRTVLPGLEFSDGPSRGDLDFKTGLLRTTGFGFNIVDYDSVVPKILADEGKGEGIDVLSQRLAPGTAALPATVIVRGGAVVDPANKHLAIERIGPARQRRWLYSLPIQGIGFDHQTHQDSASDFDGPPAIPITDSPVAFAGRLVTLWRFYFDNTTGLWPLWDDQHDAGALEWFGIMRDAGEFDGGSTWTIRCHGPESMLRRQLGSYDFGWSSINQVSNSLTESEREIEIRYWSTTPSVLRTYDSIEFGTAQLSLTGTRSSYTTEISDILVGVADGTIPSDFGPDGLFFDEQYGTGLADVHRIQLLEGQLSIRRTSHGIAGNDLDSEAVCHIHMHEKVWRILGFEPNVQNTEDNASEFDVFFRTVTGGSLGNAQSPGDGYLLGRFGTMEIGRSFNRLSKDGKDNDGAPRRYRALYQAEPIILSSEPDGVSLQIGGSNIYVEPDPLIEQDTNDGARLFAFRGKRLVGKIAANGSFIDSNGVVSEEFAESTSFGQVAELRWQFNSDQFGTVFEDPTPEFFVHRWLFPKKHGVPHARFVGEWSALADSATGFGIEIAPLISWPYAEDPAIPGKFERTSSVFVQLLASTGTASGWSGGVYSFGVNDTGGTGSGVWANDAAASDAGLAIPVSLIADPASIVEAFDSVPGGIAGELNWIRYAYVGTISSWDVIKDLIRPRGLALTLAAGRFGVIPFAPFDPDAPDVITIGEVDIYESLADPRKTRPTQKIRASGAIDRAVISSDLDPTKGTTSLEFEAIARDPGARFRRGDLIDTMTGHSLRPGKGKVWTEHYRDLWSNIRAAFLAQRHFIVSTTVSRIKGQDLWPGARVLYSHRTVVDSAGTIGVSGAQSIVLKSRLSDTKDHAYDIELLVFGNQSNGYRRFAPIAKIAPDGIAGTIITLEADADFLEHGEGDDGTRFIEPPSSEIGGNAVVCILEWDRSTWTYHTADTADVVSATGTSVTLDSAFSTTFHKYSDKFLVMVDYDAQTDGEWVRSLMLPIVQDDRRFGASDTEGFPYIIG